MLCCMKLRNIRHRNLTKEVLANGIPIISGNVSKKTRKIKSVLLDSELHCQSSTSALKVLWCNNPFDDEQPSPFMLMANCLHVTTLQQKTLLY